jgi:tRNA U34 2-thiouridine synthase MnmA/TrmU
MFRIAGELLLDEEARFVATGEVLGQRPMSQNKAALAWITKASGLDRLLLRPLSAKCLPPTLPEEKGWVARDQLMDFQGRSRKPQIALAEQLSMKDYPSPAGGCLLTEKAFSRRLRDLLNAKADVQIPEIELLKRGRHFRITPRTKLVVGRNKKENEIIRSLVGEEDLVLSAVSVPGPSVLISGEHSAHILNTAAALAAAYSDTEGMASVSISVVGKGRMSTLEAEVVDKKTFRSYII